jgi:hypothetical protein
MRPAIAVAALALAACASRPATDGPVTEDKLTKLELKFSTVEAKMTSLWKEVTQSIADLKRDATVLRSALEVQQVEIRRLYAEIDKLKSGGAAAGPKTPNGPPTPAIPTEEALVRAAAALNALKRGEKVETVVADVKPISGVAAVTFMEALGKTENLADVELLKKLEEVIASLPPKALEVPIGDALRDRARRTSAVKIIGRIGDPGLSKVLEPFSQDADEDFCVFVGQALLACKNRNGVPPLLKALKAADKQTRFLAVKELRGVNKNQALGYDFNLSPEENKEAIRQWEEWWQKFGPALFE